MKKPTSPKQSFLTAEGKASWYNYYAGYAPDFVADAIRDLQPTPGRVVDPWNGAGTTTQVADELGIPSAGYDINPVMVVIAKARLLVAATVHPSEESIRERIVEASLAATEETADDDPLLLWFQPATAAVLRTMEEQIRALLVPNAPKPLMATGSCFDFQNLSSLAAFFYVALFRVVRARLTAFHTSNPTWLKSPGAQSDRLRVSAVTLTNAFAREVKAMIATNMGHVGCATNADSVQAVIKVANSTALPESDATTAAVISSPPYCTRIDYAVATRPELAVLGIGAESFRLFRDSMIGSATIPAHLPAFTPEWGPTCKKFLAKVAAHPSKGSRNYYWKTHLLYFDGIFRSLVEIDRILQPDGDCVLVVQDSFYKEVHNDLPCIIEEMASSLEWTSQSRHDYDSKTHMARVNPGSRTYRDKTRAIESVLHFTSAK